MSAPVAASVSDRRREPGWRAGAAVAAAGYVTMVSTLLLCGVVLTRWLLSGPVGQADEGATRWLALHRTGLFDGLTGVVSRSADTLGILALAAVVLVVLWQARLFPAMALLVTGLVLELTTFLTVNALIGRDRPDVPRLGASPSTGSFPSGHTAAALVLYAVIAITVDDRARTFVWRALAWVAAALVPLMVGFSRVYRGFHHPTDVLFGYLLGCAAVLVATQAVRHRFPSDEPGR